MRKLFTIIILIFAFAFISQAQQITDTLNIKKHLGKTVTLCDYVSGIKIVADTLTLLNMGGIYPHQKFTVAIKGNRIQLDWANLKGKHLCATGVLILYKNQLEIVALEPRQIVVN
ncbi:hypothetical protein [Mucilaginibacter boryungensis]|uniref:Uncharacterized protein n=1 Tax=Mucilaginibacter boryungensis TaxID=768480 RepID=A0ABR9XK61_9SPHI|nr:hypothetical protein [Mucilaginibacter boryungensis]MBE9667797.1 hypothetical protein [Mucilaginibacter boryungensis]